MRHATIYSTDRHCVFPPPSTAANARRGVLEDTCYDLTVPLLTAVEWYWRLEAWYVTILYTIDPLTSAGSHGTYGQEFALYRAVDPVRKELDLLLGRYQWSGSYNVTNPPGDDVFNTFSSAPSLEMWHDGWDIPTDPGRGFASPPPTDSIIPSLRLRLGGAYDDGTEASLLIESIPSSLDAPSYAASTVVPITINIGGLALPAVCIDTSGPSGSAYMFGGVGPVVTITPFRWYRRAKADNTVEIINPLDGTLNIDPDTGQPLSPFVPDL